MSHESLSALLDGECSPAEMDKLLDELEHSPELMQQWSRLWMAREAREGTQVKQDQPCICAQVMARLDDMPEAVNPKVVELGGRRKIFQWKPVAGLAAAASVAAAALLVSMPAQKQDAAEPAGSFVPQIAAPVSFPAVRRSSRSLQAAALRPEELEQQDELNSLLIEHNSSMAGQGMGGTLRYARFAAHTAEYRLQQTEGQR